MPYTGQFKEQSTVHFLLGCAANKQSWELNRKVIKPFCLSTSSSLAAREPTQKHPLLRDAEKSKQNSSHEPKTNNKSTYFKTYDHIWMAI